MDPKRYATILRVAARYAVALYVDLAESGDAPRIPNEVRPAGATDDRTAPEFFEDIGTLDYFVALVKGWAVLG
jgi:hypothetical protein